MLADSIPVTRFLLAQLPRVGVDIDEALRRIDTTRTALESASSRMTTADYMRLWSTFETMDVPRDFAIRLVEMRELHQRDVSLLVALRSRNFAEATQRLARYKRLTCPEELSVHVEDGEARIRFEWFLADEQLPKFLVEATFMANILLARSGTGQDIAPKRVELARRKADAAFLRERFGCPLRFDAPYDTVVWDEAVMQLPFVTFDPDVARLLPQLEAALQHAPKKALLDDVRAALRQAMCGDRPSVERVASALHMSKRTLQRRLEQAKTSYQALLDEVRRQSARRLLSSTDLDPGDVAFLLGFEELNSFSRAFHEWEGRTPMQWRRTA
jgi:AraC-like DNA-binding protein